MNSLSSSEICKNEIENLKQTYEIKDLNIEIVSKNILQLKNFINEEKAGMLSKCAIFITYKQLIQKMKTTREKYALKTQCEKFVKDAFNDSFPGFISVLKEINDLNIYEPDILNELKSLIIKFSFSHKFFMKYDKIFQSLGWSKKGALNFSLVDYLKSLKKIGWILFAYSKCIILKNRSDIIGSTCLLVFTLNFLIERSQDFLQKNAEFLLNEPSNEISNSLRKYFHIEDQELFQSLSLAFNENISNVILETKYFNPNFITQNLKNIINVYLKSLSIDDLDETIFLNEKNLANSPSKFTPFSKQGVKNQLKNHFAAGYNYRQEKKNQSNVQKNVSNQPMNCQRILNYNEKSENENLPTPTNNNCTPQFNFLKNIPNSPYTVKGLPISTPMTAAIEMYNWLHDIYSKWKYTNKERNNCFYFSFQDNEQITLQAIMIKYLEPYVEKILNLINKNQLNEIQDLNKKGKENKHNFIFALYFKFLEKYQMEFLSKDLKTFPKTNFYNETYHIGILMCCIESTFFILNINEISFTELVNNTQLDIVKIWQCFNDFLRFDIFMPTPLKFHLLDLEIKIISYYAWKNGSSLLKTMKTYLISEEIINSSNVSNEGESEKENKNKINFNINTTVSPAPNKINKKNILEHDLIFKRILSHCGYQIFQITNLLNLNESLSENVWSSMKFIMTSEPHMMIDRHIDQLILCSLYGVCKIYQIQIKFQDILMKYQEMMSNDKQQSYEVIYNVTMNLNQKVDIITFYNNVFISTMKAFIGINKTSLKAFKDKSQTPQIKNPLISKKIIDTPLSSVLPSGFQNLRKIGNEKNPIMTPKTHMLYAFAESPLMKISENNVKKNLKINISSKKLIDFEESRNGGKNEIKNCTKHEKEQLSKIDESNNENLFEKIENSTIKTNLKIINKNELTLKLQQNPTPERNKFTSKCQTPKNDTQNFLKNLSNIQEANKTPKTLNKNKFIRLNFENTTNNLEKLN